MRRLTPFGYFTIGAMIALIIAGLSFLFEPQSKAPPSMLDLRAELLSTVADLAAIESERFVPPKTVCTSKDTASTKPGDCKPEPLDTYTQQLTNLIDQIEWEAKIGVGLAILDSNSATLPGKGGEARARTVAAAIRLQMLVEKVPTLEYNERVYVEHISTILNEIVNRLTGRHYPPLRPANLNR